MADLKLIADSGGGSVSLKAPSATTSNSAVTLKLPVADGGANMLLKTDGSGQLGWATDNSGVSLSGSTNNTVCTVTGADAIQGEANLTFDGSTLAVTGNVGIGNDASYASVDADDLIIGTTSGTVNRGMTILSPTNKHGGIYFADGDNPNGAHRGYFDYNHTTDALTIGTGGIGHVVINSSGSISVPSGQGIDFSANSHAGGMTSELLDSYEEGTYAPDGKYYDGSSWANANFDSISRYGSYVKIGNLVFVQGYFSNFQIESAARGDHAAIGLPFAVESLNSGHNFNVISTTHCTAFAESGQTNFFTGNGQTYAMAIQENSTSYANWSSSSGRYMMWSGCYRCT